MTEGFRPGDPNVHFRQDDPPQQGSSIDVAQEQGEGEPIQQSINIGGTEYNVLKTVYDKGWPDKPLSLIEDPRFGKITYQKHEVPDKFKDCPISDWFNINIYPWDEEKNDIIRDQEGDGPSPENTFLKEILLDRLNLKEEIDGSELEGINDPAAMTKKRLDHLEGIVNRLENTANSLGEGRKYISYNNTYGSRTGYVCQEKSREQDAVWTVMHIIKRTKLDSLRSQYNEEAKENWGKLSEEEKKEVIMSEAERKKQEIDDKMNSDIIDLEKK